MFFISLAVGIILLGLRYFLFYGFGISLQTMFGETCDYTPINSSVDYSEMITTDTFTCQHEECYVRGEMILDESTFPPDTLNVVLRSGDVLTTSPHGEISYYFDSNEDLKLEHYYCSGVWTDYSEPFGWTDLDCKDISDGRLISINDYKLIFQVYHTTFSPEDLMVSSIYQHRYNTNYYLISNLTHVKGCVIGGNSGHGGVICNLESDTASISPIYSCDGIHEICSDTLEYSARFNLCPIEKYCPGEAQSSNEKGIKYTTEEISLNYGEEITFNPTYSNGKAVTNKALYVKNCAAYKNLADVLPGTNYTVGNPIGNVPVRLNAFAVGGGIANQPVSGVLLKNGVEILSSGAKAPTTMTGPTGEAVLNFGYIPTTTETITVKATFGDVYDPLKSITAESQLSVLNSLNILIDCPTDITVNKKVTCSYLITDANGVTLTLAPKTILIDGKASYTSEALNSFSFIPTSTGEITISITAEKSGYISKTETITRTVGASQVGDIELKDVYSVGEPLGNVVVFSGTPNQKVYLRLLRNGQAITATQQSVTNNIGEALFYISYAPQTSETIVVEATIGEIGASSTIVVSKSINFLNNLVVDVECPVSAAKGMEVECLYEISDGVTGGVLSLTPTITLRQGVRSITYTTLVGQTGFKFIPNYAGDVTVTVTAAKTGYISGTDTQIVSVVDAPVAELYLSGPYTINEPIGNVRVKLLQYSDGVAGQDVRIELLKNNVPIESYIPISTNNIGEAEIYLDYIPQSTELLTVKATIGDVASNNYVIKTQDISVLNSLIIKMNCGGLTATVNRPVTCTWKVTDGATGAIISVKPTISITQGNKIITYQTLAGDAGITFTPSTMGEVNIKMTATKIGYVTGEDNYALPVQGLTTSFYFYIDNKESASYAGSGVTTGTHTLKFIVKESEINKDISSISGTIRTPSGQEVDITFSKKAVGEYEATYNFMQAGQTYDFSGLILPISLADDAIPFTYKITTISALTEQDKSDTTLIIVGIAGGVVVFLVLLVLLLRKKKRR